MQARTGSPIRILQIATLAVLAQWLVACASPSAPASITIADALAAPDDSKVVITAQLVQQIDSDHYLFHDNSGQITVVIAPSLLGKVKVAPEGRLRIYGEINQGKKPPVIDAKTVQVTQ